MKNIIASFGALTLCALSVAGTFYRGPVTSRNNLGGVTNETGRWGSLFGANSIWAWSGPSTPTTGSYGIKFMGDTAKGLTPIVTGCPTPPSATPTVKQLAGGYHWFQPKLRFTIYWSGTGPTDIPPSSVSVTLQHSYTDQLDDKTNGIWGPSGTGSVEGYLQTGPLTGATPWNGASFTDFIQSATHPTEWNVPDTIVLYNSPSYFTTHSVTLSHDPYDDGEGGGDPYRYSATFDVDFGWIYASAEWSHTNPLGRAKIDIQRYAWLRISDANGQAVTY